MTEEIALLFRELAGLSPAERQSYFERRHTPPELQALAYAGKPVDRLERSLLPGNAPVEQRTQAAHFFSNIALAHQNMHRYEDASTLRPA